jgi:amidase
MADSQSPQYSSDAMHPEGLKTYRQNLNRSVFWRLCALGVLSLVCTYLTHGFSLPSPLRFGVVHLPVLPDLYEASVRELQAGLDAGHFSSVHLVKVRPETLHDWSELDDCTQAYFTRIKEVNINGPGLRAVIELNPSALKEAALLDMERRRTGKRSELHGIPVLLKVSGQGFRHQLCILCINGCLGQYRDNCYGRYRTVRDRNLIDFNEFYRGMNTTAGSFSLLGSIVPEDAGVVKRLRKAGAIILGTGLLLASAHGSLNLCHDQARPTFQNSLAIGGILLPGGRGEVARVMLRRRRHHLMLTFIL